MTISVYRLHRCLFEPQLVLLLKVAALEASKALKCVGRMNELLL